MNGESANASSSRRDFLRGGVRVGAMTALGALGGVLATKGRAQGYRWQIDPQRCVHCGYCGTDCVLEQSAVRCVQDYAICGYCDLCTGYFEADPPALQTGAENQLCPTGAIRRRFIEDPYFEYSIEEDLCVGCAKCVKGCQLFGNGSFYLQVRHDRCVNCNDCSIARVCPTRAFRRVPVSQPNLGKEVAH
jgi:H+/Na+-translocating ferredoxin:NAD+ oxidoreductase subunit B